MIGHVETFGLDCIALSYVQVFRLWQVRLIYSFKIAFVFESKLASDWVRGNSARFLFDRRRGVVWHPKESNPAKSTPSPWGAQVRRNSADDRSRMSVKTYLLTSSPRKAHPQVFLFQLLILGGMIMLLPIATDLQTLPKQDINVQYATMKPMKHSSQMFEVKSISNFSTFFILFFKSSKVMVVNSTHLFKNW